MFETWTKPPSDPPEAEPASSDRPTIPAPPPAVVPTFDQLVGVLVPRKPRRGVPC